MQKMIVAAIVLLVAQIGLSLAVNMGSKGIGAGAPESLFLNFSADEVVSMEITDADGKNLLLQKEEEGWVEPAYLSVPADTDKITDILDKLAALKQGFVVAASTEAARRFKVDAESFEKHVVIRGADKSLADFYLGTSPAFRQIHARRGDSNDIITVTLGSFELESVADKWLDKSLAKIKEEDLTGLKFKDFSLKKGDDGWLLEGLTDDEKLNNDNLNDTVNKARGLSIQGILDPAEAAPLFDQPAFHFTAVKVDGMEVEYLFARENDDSFVLKLSDRDYYLKVRASAVETLQKVTREKLTEVAEVQSLIEDDSPEKQ